MALELRPSCECCDRELPPDSPEARICSFECTFCVACVNDVLGNVCPNCGGAFEARPIRPRRNWRGDNDVAHHPPSTTVRHAPVDRDRHRAFAAPIEKIAPRDR
jgi:uncharacterized protein